jgi:hypothetical protein
MMGLYSVNNIDNPATPILVTGDSLSVFSSNAIAYQWYLNGDSILLANSSTYIPVTSGNYHAEVELSNGCASISDTVYFGVTGFNKDLSIGDIQIYPNPLIDGNELKIHGDLNQFTGLELFDPIGRLIFRSGELLGNHLSVDLAGKGSGVFYLKFYAESKVHVEKIIKISY